MVLEIVDGKTYQKIIGDYKYFYNSMAFHELNRKKADEVLFFLFKGKHYKMGIAGGVIPLFGALCYARDYKRKSVRGDGRSDTVTGYICADK